MSDLSQHSMTAIEIAQPGGPEVLRPARRERPRPGAGEVLIAVEAAGVNRPDVLQRQGHYPPPAGRQRHPRPRGGGRDRRAGRRRGVTGPVGDRVCALLAGGGYAETRGRARAAVPAGARRPHRGRGGRAAGDVLHRVDQRVRARPPAARARRSSSTAAPAASAPPRSSWRTPWARACSPPPARPRSAPPASGWARSGRSTTATRGLRRRRARGDRRARRGRDPRHGGRRLHAAQRRVPGRRGPAGRRSRSCTARRTRAGPAAAAAEAAHDHRLVAAPAHAWRRRAPSRARCASTSGR